MTRILLVAAGFISIFIFPWPFAFIVCFAASLFLPGAALAYGVLYDVLYWSGGWPVASIAGALFFGISFFVRRFVKARIMTA